MKNPHLYIIYGSLVLLFALFFLYRPQDNQDQDHHVEILTDQEEAQDVPMMSRDSRAQLFELPEVVAFAGENVPLHIPEVMERYEREIYVNAYWESNMILLMKRSAKYLPTIERILEEHHIPQDFKYVAIAESGLLHVSSPAGAKGFWQLMPATAKELGLEVSNDVDERYHLEKSTKAACKYLKSAYAKFGSWTSVAASYNMGMGGLSKRKIEQRQSSYYDLLLNEETSRYVFRVLAFKEIFEQPEKFGFILEAKAYYKLPLTRVIKVDQDINDLAEWAIKHNSSYKDLKIHNPWLRSSKLKISRGKEYQIHLPA